MCLFNHGLKEARKLDRIIQAKVKDITLAYMDIYRLVAYMDIYRLATLKRGSRFNGAAIKCHDCKEKGE